MIDTDKYEGHTPAPWKASHDVLEYGHIVNNNGWRVYVGEHEKRAVIENRTFMHDDLSEANAQLIADAPLLLEAYKRLHVGIRNILSDYDITELIRDVPEEEWNFEQQALVRIKEMIE